MSGMLPCCCSHLMREIRTFSRDQEERSGLRMDVELLEEKYRWSREKQRRETRVIRFSTALDTEAVRGNTVVIPVCRIRSSVPEFPSDSLTDSSDTPCPQHLDICHPRHTTEERGITHTADSDTQTDRSISSSESVCEDSIHRPKNSMMGNGPGSRKFSAPAALSRQLSFGSYRSTPAGSRHYPFPQRKSLRKSETARRLGLYTSL